MNKYRVAFVSVLLLLGTSAVAADWNSSFGAGAKAGKPCHDGAC